MKMSETAGREGDGVREETLTVEFLIGPEVEDSWEEEVCVEETLICGIPSGSRCSVLRGVSDCLET